MVLGNSLTLVSLRGTQCRGNLRGRLSQSGMGVPPYRHSERSVGIQRSASKSSAFVRSTQIAIYHLRQRRKYQASDIAKLRLEFLSLLELIACIGCAEQSNKPSEVLGNAHTCVLPLPRRRFLLTYLYTPSRSLRYSQAN